MIINYNVTRPCWQHSYSKNLIYVILADDSSTFFHCIISSSSWAARCSAFPLEKDDEDIQSHYENYQFSRLNWSFGANWINERRKPLALSLSRLWERGTHLNGLWLSVITMRYQGTLVLCYCISRNILSALSLLITTKVVWIRSRISETAHFTR